jgi:GNAT superfamily N-acetyltransferase
MRILKLIQRNMLQVVFSDARDLSIGSSRAFIHNNSAVLSTIAVHPSHQNRGFGGKILAETEQTLKNLFRVTNIHLLAWQPCGSVNVVEFYQKNGYIISDNRVDTYDDQVQLYDLVRLHKLIH